MAVTFLTVRCCWSSCSSSSRSPCAIRCGSRSPTTSNRANACSLRSRRDGSVSCGAGRDARREPDAESRARHLPGRGAAPAADRERSSCSRRSTASCTKWPHASSPTRSSWSTAPVTLAAAGRLADRWPRGRPCAGRAARRRQCLDGVTHVSGRHSASSQCRCRLDDGVTIGTLYLATSLDRRVRRRTRASGRHADRDRQRWAAPGEHARRRPRRASSKPPSRAARPPDGTHRARRRVVRLSPAGERRRHSLLRARIDR